MSGVEQTKTRSRTPEYLAQEHHNDTPFLYFSSVVVRSSNSKVVTALFLASALNV